MRPVSDAFLSAVRSSHSYRTRARVCETFQEGVNPTGTEIEIRSGGLRFDARSSIRASLDLSTDGEFFDAKNTQGLLAPYGNEIFLESGIEIVGKTVEWVGLGYYRIDTSDQTEAPKGSVRITGFDRNAGLRDARMSERTRQYPAGYTVGQIFADLVLEVYPDATIEFDDDTDDDVTLRSQIVEEDRLKFLIDLAKSHGKTMYWDYQGVLRVESVPSPTESVFTVNSGRNGVLTSMARSLNRDGIYNAVRAEGEATDELPPVWAFAKDNNPSSPTFYGGAFGPVPRYYSSPFIQNSFQAQNAAEAILRQSLGLPYNIEFGSWINAALEVNDPVLVKYSPTLASELHVLDEISLDLSSTDMRAVSRMVNEEEIATEVS